MPWRRGERPRVAGVSSFGFSGTNAHLIVGEAPPADTAGAVPALDRPLHVLTLSAKSERALRHAATRLADRLQDDAAALADVCYTSNAGRSHFNERAAIPVASKEGALHALRQLADGQTPDGAVRAAAASTAPQLAFLFPGTGAGHVGMGRELFTTQPAFRRALVECDAVLRAHLPVPLLSVLYPEEGQPSPIRRDCLHRAGTVRLRVRTR